MANNKFKANTVLAIKLARAVYFMLKNKTVFDPERLIAKLTNNTFGPGCRQPAGPNWRRHNVDAPTDDGATHLVPQAPSLRPGHDSTPPV
jgi:hypothetical protein